MNSESLVVVVGGGISGLSTAWWLDRLGANVILLEREASAGGTIRTIKEDGWLIETGPNSALETTPLFGQMFEPLGILDSRIYANESANRRYIVRDGRLHPLPMSPQAFIASSLWSIGGKLRLLKEPFVGKASDEDESVAGFVSRRLGREFLDYAVNPFVAGVYAGDPERLSVKSAFPKLSALEEQYGGLVKGMIKGARERKQRAETSKDRARMFSFLDGMGMFPASIERKLGEKVRFNCEVQSIRMQPTWNAFGKALYEIAYSRMGERHALKANAVVLSVPAFTASRLVRGFDSSLRTHLEAISYPPVAEVYLGYHRSNVRLPLDGFGFLVPEKEHRNILGTIWSSAIFENRAPAEHVAFTTFVGGARQPDLVASDDDDLLSLVRDELASIMHVEGKPVFSRITRWERAIPQYNLGYQRVLEAIQRFEDQTPGFFLCANYRGGIAVGDCVMSAHDAAKRVRFYLAGEPVVKEKEHSIGV